MVRILIKGGVWKNSEDEILKAAVMKYGKNHWARVASLLARKSAKQCKARWHEWLDPSIKKTEWTREEDEKLLHLAKLMPTQWRTIAPAVGRTAAQCLERYEKLLDMAQDGAEPEDDIRKLKIGEIDPTPETKPARPDPIDMDEDEKEMLSEARARLANTRGKKAKRRARERQLENARRMASMQKFRELKASGIHASSAKLGLRLKRGEVDYNKEIPFEKVAPAGFYDVTHEREEGERRSMDKQERAKMLREMNKRARDASVDEKALRKKAKQNFDKLAKDNLPEALKKISQANDPSTARVRSKLTLPAPQVSDAELEEIASIAQPVSAAAGRKGEKATQGLLGEYKRPGTLGMRSVTARTPAAVDTVMQEAKNQVERLKAQTPLMGGDVKMLSQGTGFSGVTPVSQIPSTPVSISAQSVVTGRSATGRLKASMTPMRDELNINADIGAEEDLLDEASEMRKSKKREKERQKAALLQGFKRLPKPDDSYEILVKFQEESFDKEGKLLRRRERDQEEIEAEKQRERRKREEAELKKRSQAMQRGLPRPVLLPDELTQFEGGGEPGLEPAVAMLKDELLSLVKHDMSNHPLRSVKTKKKHKGPGSESKTGPQTSKQAAFSLEEIAHAQKLIDAEGRQFDGETSPMRFKALWGEVYDSLSIIARENGHLDFLEGSKLTPQDKLSAVKTEFSDLKQYLKTISKSVSKEEAKAKTLVKGLEGRANSMITSFVELSGQIAETQLRAGVYEEIGEYEKKKLNERLQKSREEVNELVEIEAELQKKYAATC